MSASSGYLQMSVRCLDWSIASPSQGTEPQTLRPLVLLIR